MTTEPAAAATRPPSIRPSASREPLDIWGTSVTILASGADTNGLYAILDYVATGLPRVGDVVPKGVRRFDTAARPAALIAGVSIRLAPLTTPPGS